MRSKSKGLAYHILYYAFFIFFISITVQPLCSIEVKKAGTFPDYKNRHKGDFYFDTDEI